MKTWQKVLIVLSVLVVGWAAIYWVAHQLWDQILREAQQFDPLTMGPYIIVEGISLLDHILYRAFTWLLNLSASTLVAVSVMLLISILLPWIVLRFIGRRDNDTTHPRP